VALAELQEAPLGVVSRHRRFLIGGQDPVEPVAALAARDAGLGVVDLREIEEMEDLRFVNRVGQLSFAQHVGQVHEGPGHAGDRNCIDHGAVVLVQPA